MPCSDVTELIHVVLDDRDRLKSYRFIKRTCGQGVGVDTLLLAVLGGLTVDEILAITPERFIDEHPVDDPIEEFLGLKHLIAVQWTLDVLTGRAAGGSGDLCAAAEISFENSETVIDARISVDLVTEQIKSCGSCRACGAAKNRKRVVFN